ncbi:Patatin-like phospholipase [Epibacterium ulvae]|uniref:Patatin-like phospholipase n=1 Tax=Epibacterium ulvae TaxID=1156985 RepID=A0A1G5R0E3_9RHOB|nr:Patatin-like phospholipase [Epibacterium ulvae]
MVTDKINLGLGVPRLSNVQNNLDTAPVRQSTRAAPAVPNDASVSSKSLWRNAAASVVSKLNSKLPGFDFGEKHLQQALETRVDDMVAVYGEGSRSYFQQVAQGVLEQSNPDEAEDNVQAAKVKLPRSAKMVVRAFDQAIDLKSVYDTVKKDLAVLSHARPKSGQIPQFLAKPDGTLSVILAPRDVETIAISGGGAKGLILPEVINELKSLSQLDGLKMIAGTSAGSLAAIAIAYDASAEEMNNIVDAVQGGLLDDPDTAANYPQAHFFSKSKSALTAVDSVARFAAKHVISAGGGAEQVVKILDSFTTQRLQGALDKLTPDEQEAKMEQASVGSKIPLDEIKERINTLMEGSMSGARTGQMVTFKDQSILHHMMPETFKELSLTGFDMDNQEGVIFSRSTTPDMPLAFAARSSIAMLGLMKPIHFDAEVGAGDSTFADGGMGSVQPTEAAMLDLPHLSDLESKTRMEEAKEIARNPTPEGSEHTIDISMKKASTLNISFARNGTTQALLSGSPEALIQSRIDPARKFVGFSAEGVTADRQKTYNNPVLIANEGGIGGGETKPSASKLAQAQMLASLDTANQIRQRFSEPVLVDVQNVADIIPHLSEAEKVAILEHGPPEMHTANIQEGDVDGLRAFEASKVLFELLSS